MRVLKKRSYRPRVQTSQNPKCLYERAQTLRPLLTALRKPIPSLRGGIGSIVGTESGGTREEDAEGLLHRLKVEKESEKEGSSDAVAPVFSSNSSGTLSIVTLRRQLALLQDQLAAEIEHRKGLEKEMAALKLKLAVKDSFFDQIGATVEMAKKTTAP